MALRRFAKKADSGRETRAAVAPTALTAPGTAGDRAQAPSRAGGSMAGKGERGKSSDRERETANSSCGSRSRRNPDERGVGSYIAMTKDPEPNEGGSPKSNKTPSPTKPANDRRSSHDSVHSAPHTPPRTGSSTHSSGQLSARRRLRMDGTGTDERRPFAGMAKLPRAMNVLIDDEDDGGHHDMLGSVQRQSELSDFGESEAEAITRSYLIQTLNRTLSELLHACEAEMDVDKCDETMGALLGAVSSFQSLRERIERKIDTHTHSGGMAWDIDYTHTNHRATDLSGELSPPPSAFKAALDDVGEEEGGGGDSEDMCVQASPPKPPSWSDVVKHSDSRSLHQKLLSPDRHRKDPLEVQRRHEWKQELAKRKREVMEAQRQERLREADQQRQERLRQIREKREVEKMSIDERLRRAEQLYQARLLAKQLKAGKEASKVHGVKEEIAFMDQLNAESNKSELQARLELAEARRLQTLEAAAKSSEKAAREEAVRQRRLALEEAKIERMQARHAQKFGSADSASGELVRASTAERDEAARQRRIERDEQRQRKVELAALEKQQRAEDNQKRLEDERMTALGAKEMRIRMQSDQLERMTKAMEEDAQKQRQALDQRLQLVLERKNRYMQLVVSKAQAASEGKQEAEGDVAVTTATHNRQKAADVTASPTKEDKGAPGGAVAAVPHPEDAQQAERRSKALKKRARKYRQRLASSRNTWHESEQDADAQQSAPGGKVSGKLHKLSRLLSDIVKGAPMVDDSDHEAAAKVRQPCKDIEGMCHILQEVHRQIGLEESEGGGKGGGAVSSAARKEERDLVLASVRKSGAIAALSRIITSDQRLAFPRLVSAALKVLLDACAQPTNRLYLVATGRVLPLVNLLDTIIPDTPDSPQLQAVATQLLQLTSACLGMQVRGTAIQAARDDTVGYIVNLSLLSKVENLLIWATQVVTATGGKSGDSGGDAERQRFTTHVRLISVSIELLETLTMCNEANGQVQTAVCDAGVVANMLTALEDCRLVGIVPLLSALFLDARIDRSWLDPSDASPITRDADTITCAASALRVLTNVAILDLGLLQRMLASVVIQSEFSHVALQVLQSVGTAVGRTPPPKASNLHSSGMQPEQAHALFSVILDELILLIGYLAVTDSGSGGHSIFAGWRNGVMMLEQLCSLPLAYFLSPRLREVLLPTLVVVTYRDRQLTSVLRSEVSTEMLATYLRQHIATAERGSKPPREPSEGLSKAWASLPPPGVPCRFHLANRFQRNEWEAAVAWLQGA